MRRGGLDSKHEGRWRITTSKREYVHNALIVLLR